jgi:hypothetical protein
MLGVLAIDASCLGHLGLSAKRGLFLSVSSKHHEHGTEIARTGFIDRSDVDDLRLTRQSKAELPHGVSFGERYC